MAVVQCRHFDGYKPCGKSDKCDKHCPALDIPKIQILVVHLEALGAVLRATSILPAIKRKYPSSQVTWITKAPAHLLLKNSPFVDRILTTETDDLLTLRALEFDIAFCIDKSLKAVGILELTSADIVYGFMADKRNGAIVPSTNAAEELWEIGLDNERKFFVNEKAETQLMTEAIELPFKRDSYCAHLSADEKDLLRKRQREWGRGKSAIVGLNTGCSTTISYKKLSVQGHRDLISRLENAIPNATVVLLGGPEDAERNEEIAKGLNVISSPTNQGLRDGMVSVGACDIVVTGDSLGMHMAIAMKRWVVAWFGPTCAQEIDLFDRGRRILAEVSCGPCWKRSCQKNPMCYDRVPLDRVISAIKEGILWKIETSSSKQPFWETFSSASL